MLQTIAMKGGTALGIVNLLISLAALAAGLAALGVALFASDDASAPAADPGVEATPPVPAPAPAPLPPPAHGSMAEVVARCLPAVVNISSRRVVEAGDEGPTGNPFFDLLRPFLGGGGPRESQSLGSGVIVDAAGVVLTNHHVVADATEIRVVLSDGRELSGRTVGTDPETDVAVLRVEAGDAGLSALPYGDSTALRQGDTVLAIGNPFGVGQTVTSGIVSATGRASMGINDYEDFIQTDAAINPGNSGGALVNLGGELVGINTAILSRTGGSHGIGFAIPSNMARPIAEALLRDGHVTRGWLGVALQDLDPQLARSMGLDPGARGVALMDIEPNGPAAAVDLRRGDVITRLDSEPIQSSRQLRNLLATRGAGTAVRLTRTRGGDAAVVSVTLAERPAPRADATSPGDLSGSSEVAGLTVAPMTDALRARYGLPAGVQGVIVVATGQGPGPSAGIQVGDAILEVAGQPVTTPERFRELYDGSFFVAMVRIQRGSDPPRVVFVGR